MPQVAVAGLLDDHAGRLVVVLARRWDVDSAVPQPAATLWAEQGVALPVTFGVGACPMAP